MFSRISVLLLILLFSVGSVLADEFYVEPPPAGNDGNAGSVNAPWATLQHAASVVGPGDTVWVREGEYTGFHLTTSGSAGNPIVFVVWPDEVASIGADNPVTPDGINLEGASHVVIDGFTVNNRTRAGVRAVLCEQVTVRNVQADGNGRWGIFTGFCDDLLIEHNVTTGSIDEHGIYVSNSGDRPVIRNNLIHGNRSNGIHMNGDISVGGDGIISEALVENNRIYNNGVGGGSAINMDGVQDSLIRNNLIFDSHASGISLYRIDGGGPSTGNRVLNNTVLVASDGRWAINIRHGAINNQVLNNILYSAHSFRGAMAVDSDSLADLSSDNNIVMDRFTTDQGNSVMGLSDWQNLTGQDMNSVIATPGQLFENIAGDDYSLSDGSPAVDIGATRPDVPLDMLAVPRPQGIAYDIGALERANILFRDRFEQL